MKSEHYSTRVMPYSGEASGIIFVAMRIANRYRDSIPTAKALRDEYGMSHSTATRWRKAMRMAVGEVSA